MTHTERASDTERAREWSRESDTERDRVKRERETEANSDSERTVRRTSRVSEVGFRRLGVVEAAMPDRAARRPDRQPTC